MTTNHIDQIIDDFSSLIMEHVEAIRDDLLPGAPRGRTARAITRYAQIIHAAELAIDTLADPAPANDDPTDSDAIPGLPSDNPRSADDIGALFTELAIETLTEPEPRRNTVAVRPDTDEFRRVADLDTRTPILQQDTRDDGNGAQVTA